MPNTNSAWKRFEAGGIITINDGTTTWTLVGTEPGSLKIEPGGYEHLPWTDRGARGADYEGDERQGKITIRGKFSGIGNANDLSAAVRQRNTSGASQGQMKAFTIVVKWPDSKGAATGHQETFAPCYAENGKCDIVTGDKFDFVDLSFISNIPHGTAATY